VLVGANGCGKTHSLNAVANWIAKVGHGIQYEVPPNKITYVMAESWHWPSLVDKLKSGQWDLVTELIEAGVLLVDELGGEYDPSKMASEKFSSILSHRENKWNMITTNIMMGDWERIMERRIASRLFRNATIIDLSQVPDYSLWKSMGTVETEIKHTTNDP